MISSRSGLTHYREADGEGSIWLVALDAGGQIAERALVSPGPERQKAMEKATMGLEVKRKEHEMKARRMDQLREKRRLKKPLTPKEKQELLDLLAGV